MRKYKGIRYVIKEYLNKYYCEYYIDGETYVYSNYSKNGCKALAFSAIDGYREKQKEKVCD